MALCEICHSEIYDYQAAVLCPADQAPHHRDCWQYYGGCGVLGCHHNPRTEGHTPIYPNVIIKSKQIRLSEQSGKRRIDLTWLLAILSCLIVLFLCGCCSLMTFLWFYGDMLFFQ